jgi:DNA-binding transcriptional regulator YhcF (GntR family)
MADEIARGLWLPGTRFPSIRASASRFHVGINTVKRALLQIVGGDKLIIPFC